MKTSSDNSVTKLTWQLPLADAQNLATALENEAGELSAALGLWEAENELWTFEVYLTLDIDPAQTVTAIENIARNLKLDILAHNQEIIDNRDWVTEGLKHLQPLQAGRFFIHGRHDRDKRRAGGINLELEAGQAFGTGHHGTTLGCLKALDRILKSCEPQNVLDLGCGTGILAIAAARATLKAVVASDIDPIAIQVACENAKSNQVRPLIKAFTAEGTHHAGLRANAPYDLIMANILAGPLMKLAPHITSLLAPRGRVILSGLLLHQAPRIIARYRNQGLTLLHREQQESWITLTFNRHVQK